MHFIRKTDAPECLKDLEKRHQESERVWEDFPSGCKKETHQKMLNEEQYYLCAYCERKIETNRDSHFEHIEPQSKNTDKLFDYENLIISCHGGQCSDIDRRTYDGIDIHSCGHKKDNDFDAGKFLNPIQLSNISDYFTFDIETGIILASEKDRDKANYTICLLNLDNGRLNIERNNARIALLKVLKNCSGSMARKKLMELLSTSEPPAFITYLRYCYRSVI